MVSIKDQVSQAREPISKRQARTRLCARDRLLSLGYAMREASGELLDVPGDASQVAAGNNVRLDFGGGFAPPTGRVAVRLERQFFGPQQRHATAKASRHKRRHSVPVSLADDITHVARGVV